MPNTPLDMHASGGFLGTRFYITLLHKTVCVKNDRPTLCTTCMMVLLVLPREVGESGGLRVAWQDTATADLLNICI